MATKKLIDSAIVGTAEQALDFICNILESSTEYSIIGKDLDGKILLWNEGARRLYGYKPEEVVGKANSSMLHVPEDIQAGRHQEIMQAALRDGKWEGTLLRAGKNGQRFTARVVIMPRRDSAGKAIGYLLISKDISAAGKRRAHRPLLFAGQRRRIFSRSRQRRDLVECGQLQREAVRQRTSQAK